MSIKHSVGKNAKNEPFDVAYVQSLLNFHILFNSRMRAFAILAPGISPLPLTVDAISVFQADVLRLPAPLRGRVDRNGSTIKALEGYMSLHALSAPIPDAAVPERAKLIYRIYKAIHDDEYQYDCSLYLSEDNRAKRVKMFEMLNDNGVDDAYLRAHVVEDYIKKATSGEAQPAIKSSGLIASLVTKRSTSLRGLLADFNESYDEVIGGIRRFNSDAEGLTMMRDSSAAPGTGMVGAIESVRDWLSSRRNNPKSIYAALDLRDPVDWDPVPRIVSWFRSF